MTWTRRCRIAAAVLAPALLAACQTGMRDPGAAAVEAAAEPRFPAAEYRELAVDGPVYRLDPGASRVRVFVFRGGPLASAGHNHVVAVTDFRGAVHLPADPGRARFDLVFPVDGLAVDRPADRRGVAGAFDSEPDAEAVRGTRGNMLGGEVLDAAAHPRVGLHAVAVTGRLPVLDLELRVTLRGARHTLTVPVWIERADERLVATGQFRLRQSDFGIEPFSALGGALQVGDALAVRFRLVGVRRGADGS